MKKLGITDKESARPCDWNTPALSEFNFLYKQTFQLVKTGQNFKTSVSMHKNVCGCIERGASIGGKGKEM